MSRYAVHCTMRIAGRVCGCINQTRVHGPIYWNAFVGDEYVQPRIIRNMQTICGQFKSRIEEASTAINAQFKAILLLDSNRLSYSDVQTIGRKITCSSRGSAMAFHRQGTLYQLNERELCVVRRTCIYLKRHISEKHTIISVAKVLGTNRSKLAMLFKKALGVGVMEWLTRLRMRQAKRLLNHSQLSVHSVGMEVGYTNSAHFSTAFKKKFMVSPKVYRANHQQ